MSAQIPARTPACPAAHRRVRSWAAAVLVVAALTSSLAACSKAEAPPPDLDSPSPTATATSSPSASPTPSAGASGTPNTGKGLRPPVFGQRVPDRVAVLTGRMPAGGERLVVGQAVVAYADARLRSFHEADADLASVAKVASGDALQQILKNVAGLQQRRQHTVGRLAVNVDGVRITGHRATATGCLANGTADVNRHHQVVENNLADAYRMQARLSEVAQGRWLVSGFTVRGTGSCA